jgi:hypothetical protein
MWFDAEALDLGPFAFFGSKPGKSLPDLTGMKIAKHVRANSLGVKAERPNIREVPLSRFERVATIEDLSSRLFGTLSTPRLD